MSQTEDPPARYYLVMYKASPNYVLWSSEKGQIHAFRTEAEACATQERAYQDGHARSYEGSMSACVHFITWQPRVVSVSGMQDLADKVIVSPGQVCRCSNVAGSATGVLCDGPEAAALYESGVTPRLIDTEELRERFTPEDARSAALDQERAHSRALADQVEQQRRRLQQLAQEQERLVQAQQQQAQDLERERAALAKAVQDAEEARRRIEHELRLAQGRMVQE